MNGDYHRFVPVPTTDLHFWYYFNETCFIECDAFQRRKKMEEQEKINKKLFNIDDKKTETIKEVPKLKVEKEPEPVINKVTEPVIEKQNTEPELIKAIEVNKDDMPIEENKDFLNQKQEHPKYEKRVLKKEDIKTDPEPDKKEKDNKTKKTKKGKNDDQASLF